MISSKKWFKANSVACRSFIHHIVGAYVHDHVSLIPPGSLDTLR
jgi:hypothetical protein